jgi:hypothetical protein
LNEVYINLYSWLPTFIKQLNMSPMEGRWMGPAGAQGVEGKASVS